MGRSPIGAMKMSFPGKAPGKNEMRNKMAIHEDPQSAGLSGNAVTPSGWDFTFQYAGTSVRAELRVHRTSGVCWVRFNGGSTPPPTGFRAAIWAYGSSSTAREYFDSVTLSSRNHLWTFTLVTLLRGDQPRLIIYDNNGVSIVSVQKRITW